MEVVGGETKGRRARKRTGTNYMEWGLLVGEPTSRQNGRGG